MTPNERRRAVKRAAARAEDIGSEPERSDGPVDRRVISDPRTMRALAHPVRLALLEALGREGELTASRAAELLDESPGNMSWHLGTLAKYGYIEETGSGKGRSRPWRLASISNRFETAAEDPEVQAAGQALESIFADQSYSRLREWQATRASYAYPWREAAFASDAVRYLTAEEMSDLGEEISALLGRYRDRTLAKQLRPAEAKPVKLVAFGHPIPPTPSGN